VRQYEARGSFRKNINQLTERNKMTDLSDLHGIYPTSIRWNAENGILGISTYNVETGERELQPIELGKPATFAMDLATRERGYGQIKAGLYDMKLTPVGTPPPPWPGDKEYKPALGCWLWAPNFGELRLETNATLFRTAVEDVWRRARSEPQAVEGQQPIICFTDCVEVPIKPLGKTFLAPVIKIINWVDRDKIPGWKDRAPTVPAPAALPTIGPSTAAPAAIEKPAEKSAEARRHKAKPKDNPTDPNDDIPPFGK
jgi:hypothetical protein